MVLAATLICGAAVFTSCSKDDEKNDEPTQQDPEQQDPEQQVNYNVYEVTLTALINDCSAPYLMINLEYTGADGVKHTETVKAADATDAIIPDALVYYNNLTGPYIQDDEDKALFSHYKVKNIKLTVPAGKSFSFKGVCAAVPDYTAPTEEFSMIRPMVLATARRVAGDSEDLAQTVKSQFTVYCNVGTAAEKFKSAMIVYVGSNCGEGTFTF